MDDTHAAAARTHVELLRAAGTARRAGLAIALTDQVMRLARQVR
jgi:hypothetical protein